MRIKSFLMSAKVLSILLFFLFLSNNSFSQEGLKIKLTIQKKERGKIINVPGVIVKFFEGKKLVDTKITKTDGVSNFKCDLNKTYFIVASKEGLVSKKIAIVTKVPKADLGYEYTTKPTIQLFDYLPGLDISMFEKPVMKIKFKSPKFLIDELYTDAKQKKINTTVMSSLANLKSAKAKKLAEEGDIYLDKEKLEAAILLYNDAKYYSPDSKDIKAKIKLVKVKLKEIKSLDKHYESAIAKGDRKFKKKKYNDAKTFFKLALAFKFGDMYATNKIFDIDMLFAQDELDGKKVSSKINIATLYEGDDNYDKLIKQSDNFLSNKDYFNALKLYKDACKLRPKEQYPISKIKEIETVYDELLANADAEYVNEKWQKAKDIYHESLVIKPNNNILIQKIKNCDDKLNVLMSDSEKDTKYEALILEASKLFEEKQYDEAKQNYSNALSIKPEETLPKEKIKEIDGLLLSLVKHEIVKEIIDYDKVIDELNKKFIEKENEGKYDEMTSILDSLAKIYQVQDNADSVVSMYEKALDIISKVGDKKGISDILDKLSVAYYDAGKYDLTLDYYARSLDIKKELKDQKGAADVYGNIGDVYSTTFRNDKALENYEKSLDIRNDIDDERGAAVLFNSMGDVYFDDKDYKKALNYYEKSMQFDEKSDNKKDIATSLNNIGIVQLKMGNFDAAIASCQKALDIYKKIKAPEKTANTLSNIGNAYRKKEDFIKAIEYYKDALKIRNDNNLKEGVVKSLYGLGRIELEQDNNDESISYFQESLDLAQKISYDHFISLNYFSLSIANYNIKKYKEAFDDFKKYTDLKGLIDANEIDNQMAEMQSKYQSTQEIQKLRTKLSKADRYAKTLAENGRKEMAIKELELEQKNQSNKIQQMIIYGFSVFILLMIIAGSILLKMYKDKKKANIQLALQNEEIMQQKEEISAQRDNLKEHRDRLAYQNEEILQQKEEILAQRDKLEEINMELEKLSIVASETDNAVIIMDARGNFEWINQGFERLYGYDYDSLIDTLGGNFVNASSSDEAKKHLELCMSTKSTVVYDSESKRKDGSQIWTQTTLTPILDYNKYLTKIVAIDSDITELKKVEQEIKETNNQLEQRNIQIMDSITYAKKIQEAILPSMNLIKKNLPNSFIFFRPKDVVSGDFYWHIQKGNQIITAAVDCTGHGVPGAFMSMIGNTLLNEIVNKKGITSPAEILFELNKGVVFALNQGTDGDDSQDDGMDMSICSWNKETNEAVLSLASHNAYVITNNEIQNIDGDIYSIGGMFSNRPGIKFTNHTIKIERETTIYMFSDGYQDQFGGPRNKKFMAKQLKEMLLENHKLSMEEQEKVIAKRLDEWKGDRKQLDDILVVGLRLNRV